MVNALIITNNIRIIQKLMDEIIIRKLNIRIAKIATNKDEVAKTLNVFHPDIIFLDKTVEDYDNVFFRINRNIIIPLSTKDGLGLINTKLLRDISLIIEKNDVEKKKLKIIKELEYIGYKFKHKGTHYLVDSILLMHIKQNSMIDNLQTNIYPIVAKKYNKTIHNVKSSINKATDCMYYECDARRLGEYFQFDDDTKPTVKQVIFTVINKIWCKTKGILVELNSKNVC